MTGVSGRPQDESGAIATPQPPLLVRIAAFDGAEVAFTLDGRPLTARAGESVLAAILTSLGYLRRHEVDGAPRAGFCLMGACQDCWVWLGPDRRGRACSTEIAEGMRISTLPVHPESGLD